MSDAVEFQEGSHIVKHWMQQHKGEDEMPHFTFTILLTLKVQKKVIWWDLMVKRREVWKGTMDLSGVVKF